MRKAAGMRIKTPFLFVAMYFFAQTIVAQEGILDDLRPKFVGMTKSQTDSLLKEGIKKIFSNPDLYNDLFRNYVEKLKSSEDKRYTFIRDLNLNFKSFQSDTLPVSLGFDYNYSNTWVKNKVNESSTLLQSYSLVFKGNVAFKKRYNPNDFLEYSIAYDNSYLWGGQVAELDEETSIKMEELQDTILERRQRKDQSFLALYEDLAGYISVTDQFALGIKGKFAFESNQDFSKKQFAPGLLITGGAKGWNKNEALRYFNILDYPFALIRLITGTDKKFTVYGATFPSMLLGIDYVIPQDDTTRKRLSGELDAYSRLGFEIGFKTRVARIGREVLHFSSDFRWYKELKADQAIKDNNLDRSTFFVAAIESNSGLFVSYSTGRLPFDRRNDQVYALGFKYDLSNKND
jgi:hypothetical protein